MKKKLKKILALTLALTMCLGMAHLTAFAAEEEETENPTAPTIPAGPYCEKEEHTHGDGCYELNCEQEESEGHAHGENCYGTAPLNCELEESEGHTHTDDCKDEEGNTICELEESEGHAHGEDCYGEAPLTCELEEIEGHTHTSACYDTEPICSKEEHTHVTACHAAWDRDTGTLTIVGVESLTWAATQNYLKTLGAKNTDVKVLVLNNVGNIESYAFSGRLTNLEMVAISSTTVINDHAFFKLSELKTVTLTDVGRLENSDYYGKSNAFAECDALTTVTLNNVDFIGAEAFRHDDMLANLTMKDVGAFGTSPFSYCIGLTSLTLDGDQDGLGTLGETMFYCCTGLTEVTLKNLDSIGNQAFYGCTSLETVNLNKVDTIGENAFNGCTGIKSVTLDNIGSIGTKAFYNCAALETVTMDNIGTVGQYAFQICKKLETVTMSNIDRIDNYAFWYCSGLTSVNSLSNVKESIGGFAFYGCSSLTGLTVDALTKMGYVGSNEEIMARVQKILAGKFQLDDASVIDELALEGWTAGAIGQSGNWNTYENGTQLMEQARWQSGASATAEVKVDAYYTGEKQMDYIFVADLSGSMAQLGNSEDNNARFYDMQSKLLDMTGKLLKTDGYDCRVAIVTFGGKHATETCNTMGFNSKADEVANYIKALEPLNENTDYGMGMKAALEVVNGQESGRNTVVVFLSDGAPTVSNYNDGWGTVSAKEIKDAGVPIYGVLHSPTAAGHDKALEVMQAVCGKDNVYESTDTESFGKAMNAAFTAAYGDNTVTIPYNAEQFDVGSLDATAGTVEVENGIITWTLNGMPFTQHTLTYTLTLKEELASRIGTYTYSINNGDAAFGNSGASVGLELTLSRSVAQPYIPPTEYTLTINYVDENGDAVAESVTQTLTSGSAYSVTSPVIEGYTPDQSVVSGTMPADNVTVTVVYTAVDELIEDEEPPLAEIPDEEPPLADLPKDPEDPEENIDDPDVPLADVPKTGDHTNRFLVMAAVSGMCLLTLLSGRKKEDEA